jgi:hypothetical protein
MKTFHNQLVEPVLAFTIERVIPNNQRDYYTHREKRGNGFGKPPLWDYFSFFRNGRWVCNVHITGDVVEVDLVTEPTPTLILAHPQFFEQYEEQLNRGLQLWRENCGPWGCDE